MFCKYKGSQWSKSIKLINTYIMVTDKMKQTLRCVQLTIYTDTEHNTN